MANVAVIGASGNVGTRLVKELSDRGHEVTGIARHPEKVADLPGVTSMAGDIAAPEALAQILKGHDAVISTVMFASVDPEALIGVVRASGVKRYLVVGGAGSLEVAPGMRVIDTPDFPAEYMTEAGAGCTFLERLRLADDLEWTFLSPSAVFFPGERTGTFRLGSDTLLATDEGSSISYEDFAIAMVDEIETPAHVRSRFTVGY
ncbi:NAD(P)-dependent oxidoreductase [Chachezhania sediminis]|uniref:NAD(P)-dependent oxidoreductase n=1 Tax=Chachezhania sediminis TaxID=2599291 RepID=UPI00131B5C43|nr:NAD(P)-dependent oxidoreductase [Chachezhania sediminis]